MSIRGAALAVFASGVFAGCAGNGEGLDQNGRPLDGDDGVLTAEFQSIQEHVFTPICTACHAGAAAPLGLRLDGSASYAMLVNAPSVQDPTLLRVAPGDPDASYLIAKLEGTASVGGRMPLDGPAVPQVDIDVIRQWILDGAAPPSAEGAAGKPVVLTPVSPLPGARLVSDDLEIVVAANGELDTTLLTRTALRLVRSDSDGGFGDGNDIEIDGLEVELRSLAPTIFAVQARSPLLIPGRYRFEVAGSGVAPLADRDARAVDGDADGEPGGDFQLEFTWEAKP